MLRYYEKLMDLIAEAIKWAVSAILLFMVCLTFLEVVRRYCFGKSFSWADECTRCLIMWVTFLGGAAAFEKKSLVCFDLVTSALNEKLRRWVELGMYILVFLSLIVLVRYAYIATTSPSVTRATGTGFKVSMVWFYLPMPVGFFLMLLSCLGIIGELIAEVVFGKEASDK